MASTTTFNCQALQLVVAPSHGLRISQHRYAFLAVCLHFLSVLQFVFDSGATIIVLPTPVYNNLVSSLLANANFTQFFGTSLRQGNGACIYVPKTPAQINAVLPQVNFTLGTGSSTITVNVPIAGGLFGIAPHSRCLTWDVIPLTGEGSVPPILGLYAHTHHSHASTHAHTRTPHTTHSHTHTQAFLAQLRYGL